MIAEPFRHFGAYTGQPAERFIILLIIWTVHISYFDSLLLFD